MAAFNPASWITTLICTGAAALTIIVTGAMSPATAAEPSKAREFTLANGLRVVIVPDHRVPVVTQIVWYAVGAADEGPHEHGVAHYFEHMMFKGTAAYPKGQFDRFVTSRGGAHNAATTMASTYYYQRAPRSALPQLMAMEADRMFNLHIEDADVASERAVVLEEFRRNEVAITVELSKKLLKALYEEQPRARTVIGADHEIKALDGTKAQSFYERFYSPNRATVIIAGDITEADARTLADATYGQVPVRAGLAARSISPIPKQNTTARVEAAHDRATTVLVNRVYLVPGVGTMSRRDASAANLFSYIAGSGMTSRLHRRLVADAAIATGIGCSFSMAANANTLDCSASGKVGVTVTQLEPIFAAVLDELARAGITDDEFDEIKSRFLATTPYRDDNVYARAFSYASLLAEGLSIADIESMESDVASLTRLDVERVAQQILRTGRNVTAILVPKGAATDAEKVQPAN